MPPTPTTRLMINYPNLLLVVSTSAADPPDRAASAVSAGKKQIQNHGTKHHHNPKPSATVQHLRHHRHRGLFHAERGGWDLGKKKLF